MAIHHIKVNADDLKTAVDLRVALQMHLCTSKIKGYRFCGVDPENVTIFAAMGDTKKALEGAMKSFDMPEGVVLEISPAAEPFADLEAEDEAAAKINIEAEKAKKEAEIAAKKADLEAAEAELDELAAETVIDEMIEEEIADEVNE